MWADASLVFDKKTPCGCLQWRFNVLPQIHLCQITLWSFSHSSFLAHTHTVRMMCCTPESHFERCNEWRCHKSQPTPKRSLIRSFINDYAVVAIWAKHWGKNHLHLCIYDLREGSIMQLKLFTHNSRTIRILRRLRVTVQRLCKNHLRMPRIADDLSLFECN
ncbi:hypothetical protein DMENIID0001_167190 [Sergentomyia squamirostris]